MSALQSYFSLLAAAQRRAVPKATRRHVHVSRRPFVVVGYHLAGDVGAPLALMWGTNRNERPRVVVVPEPRNRQLRFDALRVFGTEFLAYLEAYDAIQRLPRSNGSTDSICADAPQIVVPNQPTAEWLFGIVGRFTRHLPLTGDPAPDPVVPLAGKHLSFFHNPLPGSSLVLSATEVLATHWQTGQLPSEDLNLSALLGWISPSANEDGPACARAGEMLPPAGPLTDPNWDASELTELIKEWHAAGADTAARGTVMARYEVEIRNQLNHTWEDCWRSLELLEGLQEAPSVVHRWECDRRTWARHYEGMMDGTARFRNIPTPVQSARTLRKLEDATSAIEAQMALDDPLILAKYVADGEALSARVIQLDVTQIRRPLLTLEPLTHFTRPRGTKLFFVTNPEVSVEILSCAGDCVTAQVTAGALTKKTSHRLPSVGEEVILSPFGKSTFYPSPNYDAVPWTHRLDDQQEESIDE